MNNTPTLRVSNGVDGMTRFSAVLTDRGRTMARFYGPDAETLANWFIKSLDILEATTKMREKAMAEASALPPAAKQDALQEGVQAPSVPGHA